MTSLSMISDLYKYNISSRIYGILFIKTTLVMVKDSIEKYYPRSKTIQVKKEKKSTKKIKFTCTSRLDFIYS